MTKWIPTYKVVYNKYRRTSGDVPIDKKKYLKGEKVTVLGNIGNLKRKGYSFGGWHSGYHSRLFKTGEKFTIDDSDTNFRAKWIKVILYKIIYKSSASGGFVPIDSHSYVKGDTVTVLGNVGKLKQRGYSFVGWISSSGRYFNVGSQFVIGKDLSLKNAVLRARWKKK